MSWLILFVAGVFEIVWAVGLKLSGGFSRSLSTVVTLAAMGASFWLLGLALRSLPLGTAYAIWVGIGAVGATIAGAVLFQESLTPLRIASIGMVVLGIIGLKLAATS